MSVIEGNQVINLLEKLVISSILFSEVFEKLLNLFLVGLDSCYLLAEFVLLICTDLNLQLSLDE